MLFTSGPHSFTANSALYTAKTVPGPLPPGYFPGAGTLSFVSGDLNITRTDFYWTIPGVNSLDLLGGHTTGPNEYVGGIRLLVTQVPEPAAGLWVLALAAVWATGSRRPCSAFDSGRNDE